MPSKYWIKLYHEILHDPKMGRLPDRLWRRIIELFLLAGELDQEGLLPPVGDMAWTLRIDETELIKDLQILSSDGLEIVTEEGSNWIITHFADRQGPVPVGERVKRFRERQRKEEYYGNTDETAEQQGDNEDVTNRYTDTDKEEDTDSCAHPQKKRDFLDDLANGRNQAGISDPTSDKDRWLEYRDGALKTYYDLTELHPDKVQKGAIGNLAGESGFDLQKWRHSIESCLLGGVKAGNVSCMIDTYRVGGNYSDLYRGKNGDETIVTEEGKRTKVVK